MTIGSEVVERYGRRAEVQGNKCDRDEGKDLENSDSMYMAISMSRAQRHVDKGFRSRGVAEVRSFVLWSFSNPSGRPGLHSNLGVEVIEPSEALRAAWHAELDSPGAQGNIMAWHGTTPAGIQEIIAHGFGPAPREACNKRECEGSKEHFSLDPQVASRHSWKRRGKKGPASILLVELILGEHVREVGPNIVSTSSRVVALPRALVTVTLPRPSVKFNEEVAIF